MLNEYVKPGNVIEIIDKDLDNPEERSAKTLRTRIFDIVSDDVIKVTIPTVKGKLQLIETDGEYDVYFYTSNGLYQCTCTVKDRYRSNAIPIMELELQSNLRRYQRREYYRLNCMLEMKCHAFDEEETDEYIKTGNYSTATGLRGPNAVMVDISGGGARFVSVDSYEVGALILFRFSLKQATGNKEYSIVGRVVYSEVMENMGGKYENRAQFVDIENTERESIIKYIFEEERRIRKTTTEKS